VRDEEDIMRALHISLLISALYCSSAALGQAVQEGQILAMNERGGTVTLKLKDGSTKEYRLRDGLVFNAVQVGDSVRFTTDQENGQAVVSKVEKQ
jgi:Cu/Ag efflux protein CusF